MTGFALASIMLPFLGSILILVIPKPWIKRFSQLTTFLAFLGNLYVMIDFAATGKAAYSVDLFKLGDTLVFGIIIDKLSVLISLAFILVGFLILVYSSGYLSPQNREHPESGVKRRYYFLLLLFIGSMAGLVFSSTIIALLVFFELTGVCSWGLIGYYNDLKSLRSALKAIVTTQLASLGLYLAAAYLFAATGSFSVSAISNLDNSGKLVIFLGILLAGWGKSAQLPFIFWLPDAMVAPTPISAYLHAASMVKVGVYILARCLLSAGSIPGTVGIVGIMMAICTMVYSFAMYFPQKDLKRLLAYSTITQVSYIFLALSFSMFGSTTAFNGAVAHIFNHAFAKGLFFLVAGALSYTTGTRLLPLLKGIINKMPLIGICFAVAALAVSGTPPLNLFFSKFSIFAGGFEAARMTPWLLVPVIIAILESVGSFAWFLWIFNSMVTGKPSEEVEAATPLSPSMAFVLVVLACLTLVSGFFAMTWMS